MHVLCGADVEGEGEGMERADLSPLQMVRCQLTISDEQPHLNPLPLRETCTQSRWRRLLHSPAPLASNVSERELL